jgi:hypothetical protein
MHPQRSFHNTYKRASCCVVCCTPSYCCAMWVCSLLLCMLHAHTHTHNAHNLYIILLSAVWLPVYFSEFHFFNTYIHLHKRHHRNAKQNAPLRLYFLAHIGSQRDLRSMCEKWANYFQAEQIVRKTKGRRERAELLGAPRAHFAAEKYERNYLLVTSWNCLFCALFYLHLQSRLRP